MANDSPGTSPGRVPAACMLIWDFHMVGNMSSLQTVIGQGSWHEGFDLPKTGIQVLLFSKAGREEAEWLLTNALL